MIAKSKTKLGTAQRTPVKRKARSVVDELELIRKSHDGILRAEDVVEYATNPRSLLHDRFVWDDSEAAKQYRLEQARQLIRVSVVMLPGASEPVRAFISLKSDREESGGGYRSLPEVVNNGQLREQMLADARADAEVFRRKYDKLQEIQPIITAMDSAFK